MNRRQFVKVSIVSTGVIVGLGSGAFLLIDETKRDELTIDVALQKLDVLSQAKLKSLGEWDLYQIFTHCAQSVEYSMSEFPVHKSRLFKRTIGNLAFSIFSTKGKMSHGLSEPIPGAAPLTSQMDVTVALDRLKKSLIDFDKYLGPIAPHFAYGHLTKKEFEMAHVMHLNNHLQEISS
jgi:hypothetical protein